jgi:hypothetical protein
MFSEKIILAGHSIPLNISTTFIGLSWTVIIISLLLTEKGRMFLSSYKSVALFFILLGLTLLKVFSGIEAVQQMANGLKILDTRLSYNTGDILTFATNLGEAGREKYAAFQFGFDTWAPPAFASFVSSVAFTVLPREKAINCLKLIFIYLFCAVAANALMPVIMLNFEYINYPGINLLSIVVPWLDFLKYFFHLSAWIFIGLSLTVFSGKGEKVLNPS